MRSCPTTRCRRCNRPFVVEAGYGAAGLGIYSIDLECGRFWGHSGGILDYATLVQASEDGKRVAVVSVRSDAFAGQPPDEAALLCPGRLEAEAMSVATPPAIRQPWCALLGLLGLGLRRVDGAVGMLEAASKANTASGRRRRC